MEDILSIDASGLASTWDERLGICLQQNLLPFTPGAASCVLPSGRHVAVACSTLSGNPEAGAEFILAVVDCTQPTLVGALSPLSMQSLRRFYVEGAH